MKLAAVAILLALLTASPEIRYFRYERPITNVPQQAGQVCLAIDPGVFAHGASHLADLRLYRDSTEMPYVIRVSAPMEAGEKAISPLNVGVRDGQTVFDAELPDERYSDLRLSLTAKNFIATVMVSGSRSKTGGGETKLGSYTIFDLTRQKLGRSAVLHLPESNFRYLHFRIAGPVSPESVSGLSVERLPATQPNYLTLAQSSHVTQTDHASVLEFTVPAHVPVDRIAFIPGAAPAFFSRDVSVSVEPVAAPGTDAEQAQRTVTSSGNLLRIHSIRNGRRIDAEHLEIDTPSVSFDTQSRWTIRIDNGDDVPLTLQSAQLQMLEQDLCFEAAAGDRLTLYYGDPALNAPRYDYATLFTPQTDAATAIAGPEQPNPAYEARPDERAFTERHSGLLWAALIAMIALLAGIALQSARRPA